MRGNGPLEWGELVPLIVHPMRLAILEAMLWIDEPLAAVDIEHMCGGEHKSSLITYHLKYLASRVPVLRFYDEPAVDNAFPRKRYYFRERTPASMRAGTSDG